MTDYNHPPHAEPTLTHEIRRLPRWKIGLLAGSLAVGVVGVTTHFVAAANHKTVTTTHTVVTAAPTPGGGVAPPGSSGFMGGGGTDPAAAPMAQTTTTTTPAPDTLMDQAGPFLGKFGFSFFVGLVLGFLTRTFVKIAAGVGILIVAAGFALHYFHVDVDTAAVQQQAASVTSWVQSQLGSLKDLVFAHLPSAGAAGAGFLFGLKRR